MKKKIDGFSMAILSLLVKWVVLSVKKMVLFAFKYRVTKREAKELSDSIQSIIFKVYIFINKLILKVMGKIKQGILGAVSGKVGSVVGSSWKGKAIVKIKPASVANPKTAGQIAQRGKFSNAVAFAVGILATVIKPLWDRFASGMSGYNDFVSQNVALFSGVIPSPVTSFVLSKGKMAATAITAVLDLSSSNVAISWTNDTGEGYKLGTDAIYAIYINVTKQKFGFIDVTATRANATGTGSIELQGTQAGDSVYVFAAFRRADGSVVSNSSYAVATVQA